MASENIANTVSDGTSERLIDTNTNNNSVVKTDNSLEEEFFGNKDDVALEFRSTVSLTDIYFCYYLA